MRRRKELRRRKRLADMRTPLVRTPMKRRNKRRAKRRYERDFGTPAVRIREMSCCNCGAPGPSDPHHEPLRSQGGTSADLAPVCRKCHNARHDAGSLAAFMEQGGVDLRAVAISLRASEAA